MPERDPSGGTGPALAASAASRLFPFFAWCWWISISLLNYVHWDEKKPQVFPVGLHGTWGSGRAQLWDLRTAEPWLVSLSGMRIWPKKPSEKKSNIFLNKIPGAKGGLSTMLCTGILVADLRRRWPYLVLILYRQAGGICPRKLSRSPSGIISSPLRAGRKFPRLCFLISSGKLDDLMNLHPQPILLPPASSGSRWAQCQENCALSSTEPSWEPRV